MSWANWGERQSRKLGCATGTMATFGPFTSTPAAATAGGTQTRTHRSAGGGTSTMSGRSTTVGRSSLVLAGQHGRWGDRQPRRSSPPVSWADQIATRWGCQLISEVLLGPEF
jgi:hypothetical protein